LSHNLITFLERRFLLREMGPIQFTQLSTFPLASLLDHRSSINSILWPISRRQCSMLILTVCSLQKINVTFILKKLSQICMCFASRTCHSWAMFDLKCPTLGNFLWATLSIQFCRTIFVVKHSNNNLWELYIHLYRQILL
jgi:hypothetical protein